MGRGDIWGEGEGPNEPFSGAPGWEDFLQGLRQFPFVASFEPQGVVVAYTM